MRKAIPVVWSVAAIAALSIPLTISISNAQDSAPKPDVQNRPPIQPGQPGPVGAPTQPAPFPVQSQPGQFRPMGGGGVTMAIDGAYIYLVQGNRIMKISKDDLKITKSAELMPMDRPAGGADRARDGETKSD